MNNVRCTLSVRTVVSGVFLSLVAQSSVAQERLVPPRGDGMIDGYLARDSDSLNSQPEGGATTASQWEASRPRLKRELLDMLGLLPIPERTPLHAKVTGIV